MIIGENCPDFWEAYYPGTSRKYQTELGLIQKKALKYL
jgi:hypothetical protein